MNTALLLDGSFGFWKGVWWFVHYKIPPRIHRDSRRGRRPKLHLYHGLSNEVLPLACD